MTNVNRRVAVRVLDDEWASDDDGGWDEHNGRSLQFLSLPLVELPSMVQLARQARSSTLWRRITAVLEGVPEVAADDTRGGPDAADVSTCVRLVVDGWRCMHQDGLEKALGSIDHVVLFEWAGSFSVYLDLLTPPSFGRRRVGDVVADLWALIPALLFDGRQIARSTLLRFTCVLLHPDGDRHHAWCGLVQRELWRVVRQLEDLGAVTVTDGVVVATDLGRYGIHHWIEERGGLAPVRLASDA